MGESIKGDAVHQLEPKHVQSLTWETDRLAATIASTMSQGMSAFVAVNIAFNSIRGDGGELNIDEVYAMYCVAVVMLAQERVDQGWERVARG